MKPVLILLNITLEGPGYIADFLKQKDIPFELLDLYRGDRLPETPEDYGAIVVMGGPMNVYDDDQYPYLKPEKEFIRQCVDLNVPYLGVCLGGQLLAVAAGSGVTVNASMEIGWLDVNLTEDGKKSPLFKGLSDPLTVFHWHGDMFEIPLNCPRLAETITCRNQAFSIGDKLYGLQFHLETSQEDIIKWGREYLPLMKDGEEKQKIKELIDQPNKEKEEKAKILAYRMCENFFGAIVGYSI